MSFVTNGRRKAPMSSISLAFKEKVVNKPPESFVGVEGDRFLYHKYCPIKEFYGSKCLDVGAGSGTFSEYLRKQNHQVSSVDIIDHPEANDVHVFNGKDIPFADDSFNTSILMFVLHHTNDQEKLLKDVIRVTTDHIIVAEDIVYNLFDRLLGAIHLNSSPWSKAQKSFRTHTGWLKFFDQLELELVDIVKIPRWSKPYYPVVRKIYVLKVNK